MSSTFWVVLLLSGLLILYCVSETQAFRTWMRRHKRTPYKMSNLQDVTKNCKKRNSDLFVDVRHAVNTHAARSDCLKRSEMQTAQCRVRSGWICSRKRIAQIFDKDAASSRGVGARGSGGVLFPYLLHPSAFFQRSAYQNPVITAYLGLKLEMNGEALSFSSEWGDPLGHCGERERASQLAAGTCEIVTLDRDSSQPRRTIARQTARCACRKGQIAGTTRASPACVDALQMGYRLLVQHLGVAREVLHHRSRSQNQDGTHSTSSGDYRVTIHSVETQSLPSLHMEVAAHIVRNRQWCEMMPCLDDEGCDLLVNRSGWTCAQPNGRVKTTTELANAFRPLMPETGERSVR
ncbi:Protein FAM19A5 [Triplophysa tibetana]|uniref:Protein FAM19A5 n=1 Tax=Triplophysa tibetana TaxID=1572043 RepID=A0A5A9PPX9_9TELE|nr:Protein FAM19A5 [Triplophysa tibetana]